METNYVILLDYSSGEIIKIRLTDEEIQKSESYEDFEMFLSTIESKYNFRLKDCYWMSVEYLKEVTFKKYTICQYKRFSYICAVPAME